jgi:hypothetical protein
VWVAAAHVLAESGGSEEKGHARTRSWNPVFVDEVECGMAQQNPESMVRRSMRGAGGARGRRSRAAV